MNRVENKVAVVTGALGGIGGAICSLLAREGATVYAIDLAKEPATPLGQGITYLACDITQETQVAETIAAVLAASGRIDILVNNAGIIGPHGPSHLVSQEQFEEVFAVNVRGPWLCTKYTVPTMLEQQSGSIVDVSSINGIVGGSAIPVYHASKGAVRLMAKSDAITYAKDGIRVNSIHPGSITTAMSASVVAVQGEVGSDYEDKLIAAHPLGHRGEPDDIAYGVLYLASDESKFVTGSELVVDGGYTAR
ncbi:glucose 1-dehydrogenase [Rhodococcus ruber]|uniref:Glucose 1-dehydrogenase n=1 Tax=Rhodococcus ruber TaxID=1830 RepID=A0ABT4MGM8_9NOCA|nr:glucose 1-dehydrogenase [Rhodococcus ruber]MCZ4518896.1 glucose 1-dehydrogenase [Rhodococcus ruber]